MPDLNADQILTYKHKRAFVQYGGSAPTSPVLYAGANSQYMMIEGVSAPELGGVDPIWIADDVIGRYRLVGRQANPAELPSATLIFREKHGSIPRQLLESCPFNFYEVSGKCADLTDFLNGWDDYVLVYENAIVTDKDLGQRTSFDGDEPVQDSLSVTLAALYPIGSLNFGEVAAPEITTEVADVVFGSNLNNCLGCHYGDEYIYAVTKNSGAGSPGYPVEVIYSVDGGQTWTQINVDEMGATEEAYAIDIAGKFLIVLGEDAYYYAEINRNSGVPGAFSKVTSGIVAAGSPKDIFVANASSIFFVGDGGYIYKSVNVTAGVTVSSAAGATSENLARISGYADNALLAVGENGAIVVSRNGGRTWGAVTAPDAALDYQAVAVLGENKFYVGGAATAKVYFTNNGGESWTEVSLGITAGDVEDILFVTESVGYVSITQDSIAVTGIPHLFSTWNGGYGWSSTSPRITNFPTFTRANRLAAPKSTSPGISSNTIAVAGLAGDDTDGVLYLGVSAKV